MNRRKSSETVGIMADSHGSVESIISALDAIREADCRIVFHLGDICDSLRPETAAACIQLLQDNGVRALLGNNDRSLLIADRERNGKILPATVRHYLESLPPSAEYQNTVMVHSLPFHEELGFACLTGSMNAEMASRWLRENPQRFLFRGHSHNPEIIYRCGSGLRVDPIEPGTAIQLDNRAPCIITCGALTRGLYMLWLPDERVLTCAQFLG